MQRHSEMVKKKNTAFDTFFSTLQASFWYCKTMRIPIGQTNQGQPARLVSVLLLSARLVICTDHLSLGPLVCDPLTTGNPDCMRRINLLPHVLVKYGYPRSYFGLRLGTQTPFACRVINCGGCWTRLSVLWEEQALTAINSIFSD